MQTRVGIIGAGFAGVAAAKRLCRNPDIEIQIIDRRNHHLFQPLLYQVAMAGLNPSEIAVPIRKLFSKRKNVKVTLAEVEEISVERKAVFYDESWHTFDYLIVACGAKHFYFGNDDWEQIAPGLKNIEQATEIRRRILTAFELAEKAESKERQKEYLRFAVVGGGPTGVELAGAIAEMARTTLMHDFRAADLSQTEVYLIEAGSRVLAAFPEKLSMKAEADLKDLGVTVIKNTRASDLSAEGLLVGEERIAARTIIWAAGVKPASVAASLGVECDPSGRVIVGKDLSLARERNVFVLGDMANFTTKSGESLPGIAPVAVQEGEFAARMIENDLVGLQRTEFEYWDKGIMATIGRSRAVVRAGAFNLTGLLAWLVWVFVHILYLMQFKNKVFVFFQWAWAYFNFGRGARLIIHKNWRFYSGKKISYEPTASDQ